MEYLWCRRKTHRKTNNYWKLKDIFKPKKKFKIEFNSP